MEVIYLLIPISLILLGLIVWILLWAVRSGQYDDMEGPAHQILLDEERVVQPREDAGQNASGQKKAGGKDPAGKLCVKSRSRKSF